MSDSGRFTSDASDQVKDKDCDGLLKSRKLSKCGNDSGRRKNDISWFLALLRSPMLNRRNLWLHDPSL